MTTPKRTLAEILAEKKMMQSLPFLEPEPQPEPEKPSLDQDLVSLFSITPAIDTLSQVAQPLSPADSASAYPIPDAKLFVAIHAPFIRDPYNGNTVQELHEYRRWLLSPSFYVLNTFKGIDAEALFTLYMKHNPPQCIADLRKLSELLFDLALFCPAQFQQDIEELVVASIYEK